MYAERITTSVDNLVVYHFEIGIQRSIMLAYHISKAKRLIRPIVSRWI